MSTSGSSTGKILKRVLILFGIVVLAFILFFILSKRKAIQLVFPDLNKINKANFVIKKDSLFTSLSIVLQNKNPYKLSIDTLFFDVKLNDTSIALQSIPLNIRQKSFQKDTVKIPLNLSMHKIKNIIMHLKEQDSTYIEARGYVVYKTLFGRAKLDFEKRARIEVPIPPEIKVVDFKREKYNFRTKTLKTNALIEIKNMGKAIDLQLSEITYELTIKDNLHYKGKLSQTVTVKPRSSIQVNVPMNFEVLHPLKTKWLILTDNDRLPYTLHITCVAKEKISDKEFSSPVDLKTSGFMELKK